jgi:hypothetical protein
MQRFPSHSTYVGATTVLPRLAYELCINDATSTSSGSTGATRWSSSTRSPLWKWTDTWPCATAAVGPSGTLSSTLAWNVPAPSNLASTVPSVSPRRRRSTRSFVRFALKVCGKVQRPRISSGWLPVVARGLRALGAYGKSIRNSTSY